MIERLGPALQLMHEARTTYTSLRATLRTWRRTDLVGRVLAQPETDESTVHLWVEAPTRWRIEHGAPYPHTQIRLGGHCWTSDPNGDFRTRGGRVYTDGILYEVQPYEEIWDPALLIPELWLEPVDRTSLLGREGLRLAGTPRPNLRPSGETFIILPPEADACELLVDLERGIVLRLTASLDGELIHVDEVTELAFDEEFPGELFSPDALPHHE